MSFYHVDGQAGTGKSTLTRTLRERGYRAFDADKIFGYWGNPTTRRRVLSKAGADWFWDSSKLERTLASRFTGAAFICGCSANSEEFWHRFVKVFFLYIDTATLEHRLKTRTNNNYGKKPEQLAYELDRNEEVLARARARGAIIVDATRPVSDVADEILSQLSVS